MSSKFTNRLKKILERAKSLADFKLKKEVELIDVLESLIQEKGSIAREMLLRAGLSWDEKEIKAQFSNFQKNKTLKTGSANKNISLSTPVKTTLERAVSWAAALENKYVGTEHMLFGLLKSRDKQVVDFLVSRQVEVDKLLEQLETVFVSQKHFPQNLAFGAADFEKLLNQTEIHGSGSDLPSVMEIKRRLADGSLSVKSGFGRQKDKDSLLGFFGRDLTDPQVQEKIDPVIGREDEINRIIQILSRRNKNNPILLGDAGVGKTAIVEGLAKKILEGEVPDILLNKKIYALDLNMILSGTMMRGEFEMRLKQVLDEVKEREEVILFIDEIHNIVGAGAISGAMDAANILKPALARGEIRCIGATTHEDYKKYIENDPALERRFQPVIVAEPSPEEAVKILCGIKQNYERHHQVKISQAALEAAVHLSVKYIPERFLPDKAIDLIDEAAARLKVNKGVSPIFRKIKFLESKLEDLIAQKTKAVGEGKYSRALQFKEDEIKLVNQILTAEDEVNKTSSSNIWLGEVTAFDVARVVSEMKKIPLADLSLQEGKKIAKLEKTLKKFIVGQDDALSEITFFIKRARAGLAPVGRPLGSFIFLGPSGVGKTYTAKVLAKEVFGSEDRLIRLDMSEFSESFNISRLIGSPPGYVGFKEGGKLTEKVRRQPYSLVLFDEIEKAHPQVFNLLLQIMEDGHLTDAVGKVVDFKNTIIVLTSNLGLQDGVGEVGFGSLDKHNQINRVYENLKIKINQGLQDHFNPEFLSRLDKIVIFRPLDLSSIEKITTLELKELKENLKHKKIEINFTAKFIKWVAKKSFSSQTGAREVRRMIQQEAGNLLTEKILVGEIKKGDKVELGVKDDKIEFKFL